jgi:TIR domain
MTIFISWSGSESRNIAIALKAALETMFHGCQAWVSSEDIHKGSEWFTEVIRALDDARFAIVCVTRQNLSAPWLMFEAGVIASRLASRDQPPSPMGAPPRHPVPLVPLLCGCAPEDLPDALKKFQHAQCEKDELRRLFMEINGQLGATAIAADLFAPLFAGVWPPLDLAIQSALNSLVEKTKKRFNVFLSVPMAALDTEQKYARLRKDAMKVFLALRDTRGWKVYWPMERIPTKAQFDTRSDSVLGDLRALNDSACLVILYPKKILSSVIFEAGFAVALGTPVRIFVHDRADLPFLMQELPQYSGNIRIHEKKDWRDYDNLAELIGTGRLQILGA